MQGVHDRRKQLNICCTGHHWIYFKALADTVDDDYIWLVIIAYS